MILSTWLPYIFIGRVMFMYHFFVTLPFIMLAIVSLIKWINEKTKRNYLLIIYMITIIVLFAIFYPITSGMPISKNYITSMQWLKTWTF